MNPKLLLVFLSAFLLLNNLILSQGISELNRIKAINIPPLEYIITNSKGGATTMFDVYGIRKTVAEAIQSTGIEVLNYNNEDSELLRVNCEVGHCLILQNSVLNPDRFDEVEIIISDCNFNTIYHRKGIVRSMVATKVTTAIPMGIGAMQQATKEALIEFNDFKYQFNENEPIIKTEIPQSKQDLSEIKRYLRNEEIIHDQIEGVYICQDVDFYILDLAIVKNIDAFDIVVLNSDNISWKPCEIRGQLKNIENSLYKGFWTYSSDQKLELEVIVDKSKKNFDFKFVDLSENEYFILEFKRKSR